MFLAGSCVLGPSDVDSKHVVILYVHDLCYSLFAAVRVQCFMRQSAYHAGETCAPYKHASVLSTQKLHAAFRVCKTLPSVCKLGTRCTSVPACHHTVHAAQPQC